MHGIDRLAHRLGLAAALAAASPLVAQAPAIGGTDGAALRQLERRLLAQSAAERTAAVAWAARHGLPMRVVEPDGTVIDLVGLRDGWPVYYASENARSADTISSDEVWPGSGSGLGLTGAGVTLFEWDSGNVLLAHQEFGGRVIWADNTDFGPSGHSTHVAGTLIAAGIDPAAHGMAPGAMLAAYDSAADEPEMAAAASAVGALVSNHSYGQVRGWAQSGGAWYWYGDVGISPTEDARFGFYDGSSQCWDQIAHAAPYYLICISAGNDRNDAHAGEHFVLQGGAWTLSSDPRDPDGGPAGYDSLNQRKCAKNVLTDRKSVV